MQLQTKKVQNISILLIGQHLLNWVNAQLHFFLNFSQFLVSCLPLLDKLD